MKKLIAFIIALLIIATLILCGCGWNSSAPSTENNDGRMMLIYNDGFASIYVDTKTGVEYFSRSGGGTCVMIDSYGNPYIYPAFDAREDRLPND